MPDPSVRYGRPLENKGGSSNANPLNLLNQLLRGNKQGQQLTGPNPGGVVGSAKKRSSGRSGGNGNGTGYPDIDALQGMLGSFGGVDPAQLDQLKAELQKAIAGQFDPQITGVNKDIAGAKSRAAGAKKDIGTIYSDLVNYYQGQVAPTKERSKKAKEEAANNASGTKESITNDYATRIREQVDEFKRLGIEAATPSATDQQDADRANALAVADMTNQGEQAALNQQAEADLAYWNEGSGIAKREGAEQQSVITQQLNDYLNQQGKQLELLKGQKTAAYNQGLMQLQQQAATAASQQQNQMWDRMLDLAKLKMSAAKGSGSTGSSNPGTGLTGALSFLQQSGAAPLGNTFQQYLAESQRWANTPQARAMYGGAVDTPEEWAQVMRDNAANKGLNSGDQTSLWQAMLRYMGRR